MGYAHLETPSDQLEDLIMLIWSRSSPAPEQDKKKEEYHMEDKNGIFHKQFKMCLIYFDYLFTVYL